MAQELKEILNKYFQGKELKKINETTLPSLTEASKLQPTPQ